MSIIAMPYINTCPPSVDVFADDISTLELWITANYGAELANKFRRYIANTFIWLHGCIKNFRGVTYCSLAMHQTRMMKDKPSVTSVNISINEKLAIAPDAT